MLDCKFCGKCCKNDNSLRNHERLCKNNPDKQISNSNNLKNLEILNCSYCSESFFISNLKRHENSCYLNPDNIRFCLVCESPIKNYKTSKGTCSCSCSNIYFSGLRNKPENYKSYVTICWKFHKKECIVCGENKIVAVHHYNEDHNDNRPENLVPLCPTHHQYVHSRHKNDILHIIEEYVNKFNSK